MTKKIIALLSAIFLCRCSSVDKGTGISSESEVTTEAPTFPVSSYLDMSDMVFVEKMEDPIYDYTNNYLGEKAEHLTKYYDLYRTTDGKDFEFYEDKRLRFYSNMNADNTEPEKRFTEEYLREYCDNVLREVVTDYDKFEYHDSTYYYGPTTYELSMIYETETHDYYANISLSRAGEIEHISVHYIERATEEQIDHEYFDALFEKQIDTMFDNYAYYHHYTLDHEDYYLYGDYVYAEYGITTYDEPTSDGSYPAFCHTFGFAKTLE